ncbi:MAG: hypothetical protein KGI33_12300 [Thaumarchaeota archaeon]|nr:hypothetical protein [Nitrososphaerota archaeon]
MGAFSDPALILPGSISNAEINAAAAIAWSKITVPANVPVIATGTYSGNSAVGRAIAHGLGRVPKMIVIQCMGSAIGSGQWITGMGNIWGNPAADTLFDNGGTPDATNFYVGSGAPSYFLNFSFTYYWIAIG